VCFDPTHIDEGGTLVTPYFQSEFPPADKYDVTTSIPPNVVDPNALLTNPQLTSLLKTVADPACIPPGRYAINVVYATGQAWTVPNEAGHCAIGEGITLLDSSGKPGSCGLKSRPVLTSQGTRAVVEITDQDPNNPNDPTKKDPYCHDGKHNVPLACGGDGG
jgi:hypothetical protein